MEEAIVSQLSDEENGKVMKKTKVSDETEVDGDEKSAALTAAQRARAERNRQRALALKQARLVQRPA